MIRSILLIFSILNCFIAQSQIWQAVRTSKGQFTYERDGQEIAFLRDGTAVAVGGWHVIGDNVQETNNEVYISTDKGVRWQQQANAPWPASHDFIFESSVSGDTLVKYGIDGGNKNNGVNPRIDIYTKEKGWELLYEWDADSVNDGTLLTGCRHGVYYYMLSYNGRLHRFSLDHPEPELVAIMQEDATIHSGFMISLPSGRMIYGGGMNPEGQYTGNVYYSDDDGFHWNLLIQDDIFKTYWCAAAVLKTGVMYWKGRNDASNQKGVYIIPIENLAKGVDPGGWREIKYSPQPRHAQGFCTVLDENGNATDEAIGVSGNLWNDSWLFKRIDYDEVQDVFLRNNCSFTVPDLTDGYYNGSSILQTPAPGTIISSSHGQTNEITISSDYGNGYARSYKMMLYVRDTTEPVFALPEDSLVYLDQNSSFIVPDIASKLVSTKQCKVVQFKQSPISGTTIIARPGTKQDIVITADDGNGNKTDSTITLTVVDTIPPKIVCPEEMQLSLLTGRNAFDTSIVAPTALDNCSNVIIKGERSDSMSLNSSYRVGTTTITWRATDSSGNASTCLQKIIVTDNELPTISNLKDLLFCYQSNENFISIPPVEVNDNVGVDTVTYVVSGATERVGSGKDASGYFNKGRSKITWTVTDIDGNVSNDSMHITIADPLNAEIENVADTIYPAFGFSPIQLRLRVFGGIAPYKTLWSNGSTDSSIVIDQRNTGHFVFSVTATDSLGCEATVIKEITIADTIAPRIICPQDIEVSLPEGKSVYDTSVTSPLATDNCSAVKIVGERSDGFDLDAPYHVGTITITWQASDESGNVSTCIQKMIVKDNEPPTIIISRDIFSCYQSGLISIPAITATDNCQIEQVNYIISGATVRQGEGTDASGYFGVGTSKIVWSVTDINGNTTTASINVTIGPSLHVEVPDIMTVSPGGIINTIYPDYSTSPSRLNVQVSGGIPPYKIKWSTGATDTSIVIGQESPGKYVYSVTVTDSVGCEKTILKEINIIYVRCGTRMDNYIVCVPEGNTYSSVCVSREEAKTLFDSGGYLGICNDIPVPQVQGRPDVYKVDSTHKIFLNVIPNPSSNYFTLFVRGDASSKTSMRVYSATGTLIETRNNLSNDMPVRFGSNYHAGTYFVEVRQGNKAEHIMIIKTNL